MFTTGFQGHIQHKKYIVLHYREGDMSSGLMVIF